MWLNQLSREYISISGKKSIFSVHWPVLDLQNQSYHVTTRPAELHWFFRINRTFSVHKNQKFRLIRCVTIPTKKDGLSLKQIRLISIRFPEYSTYCSESVETNTGQGKRLTWLVWHTEMFAWSGVFDWLTGIKWWNPHQQKARTSKTWKAIA